VTEFDSVEQAIAAHEPRLSRGTQGARQRVRTRRAHRRRGGLKTFHANESVTGRNAHTAMSALGPGCVKTPTSNLSVESLSRLH
jgi:hypothetical protein